MLDTCEFWETSQLKDGGLNFGATQYTARLTKAHQLLSQTSSGELVLLTTRICLDLGWDPTGPSRQLLIGHLLIPGTDC